MLTLGQLRPLGGGRGFIEASLGEGGADRVVTCGETGFDGKDSQADAGVGMILVRPLGNAPARAAADREIHSAAVNPTRTDRELRGAGVGTNRLGVLNPSPMHCSRRYTDMNPRASIQEAIAFSWESPSKSSETFKNHSWFC
jgi:hypothetical protein